MTSPETVCLMGVLLTLVKQLFKLSRAGDQQAVKPGGVIMVVRLMVSGRMQSERDEVPTAIPQLGREDVLLCFLMLHQKCHNHRQTSEEW